MIVVRAEENGDNLYTDDRPFTHSRADTHSGYPRSSQ
jgi:hypothetical protein